jgi:ribose transport system substrate-binding protein
MISLGMGVGACGGSSTAASSLKVGVVDFDITSVPAQREATAVSQAMKSIGWTVIQQDAAGDIPSGNSICQAYVTEGFNVIVVDVFSGSEMAQCLSSAKAAKIPVFFLASSIAPGMAGNINTVLPTAINELFIAAVKKATNPQILSLQYSPAVPCLDRQQSMDQLRTAAGIPASIVTRHEFNVNAQSTDSEAATVAWLDAHPASLGQSLFIWSCTSPPAIGALAALQEAGRTAVQYTWDLTSQLVPDLENGSIAGTSISNTTVLGTQLIGMIKRYEANHNATPENLQAQALVLTQANIANYAAHNAIAAG